MDLEGFLPSYWERAERYPSSPPRATHIPTRLASGWSRRSITGFEGLYDWSFLLPSYAPVRGLQPTSRLRRRAKTARVRFSPVKLSAFACRLGARWGRNDGAK